MVELGGNISLEGFSDIDKGAMVIVKKIVGNYGRRFTDANSDFEKLHVSIKDYDKSERQYKIGAKLTRGGVILDRTIKDQNLFMALDLALKEIEKEL